jgi:hypothetical protein
MTTRRICELEKQKVAKVTMSLDAETLLNSMVAKTNDGFTGGRLTKHDQLSWIVTCFAENYFERNIEKIRQDHFDRVAHLENLLKRVKKARHLGTEDQDAELKLKQMMDSSEKPKERQQKMKLNQEAS